MVVEPAGEIAAPPLLHELVAAQAACAPDAPAVSDPFRELSYLQLNDRANQLAHLLRNIGVRAETPVGICLHRSVDLAVALLAVWKSGGAYVPLDPSQPAERLTWMLRDSGAAVVLTEAALVQLVQEDGVRVLQLDACAADIDRQPVVAPHQVADRRNLAYIIYTSGSTGRPKGVAVSHEGIGNRVRWTVRVHGLGPGDRLLQKTSMGFDAAGWEIFGPLIAGATVVMAPVGAERDPAVIVAACVQERITVLQVVPSVLRLLVDDPELASCSTLRLLFSAGEPLTWELCRRLLDKVNVQIWNTYGPTECSIDVTAHPVVPTQSARPVPIGRPLQGIRTLVLDPRGGLVPVGMPGELHIGGLGLARGYVGQPARTAERFVPDQYGEAGQRLYRTGDLARWWPDGTLEYLGRLDDQVKVNGVRIEPGELESALSAHPSVRASAIGAARDKNGLGRIVAYLTVSAEVTNDELRSFLRQRLPEYMIPSVFVVLDELPLNHSGKLDRSALPDPSTVASSVRSASQAPRSAAEQAVARVWAELLDRADIGVYDDFFTLGGYSLLLNRLAQRLRDVTGCQITLAELFEASTVHAQARLIESTDTEIAPIVATPRCEPLPLSSGQRGMWFLEQLTDNRAEYVVPLFLELPMGFVPAVVEKALTLLADRHEILRTCYPLVSGTPVQRVQDRMQVELSIVDATARSRVAVFEAELARGFDLASGPVWRALLVHSADEPPVLLATVHHIATDGWSMRLLEKEFQAIYETLANGGTPELAPVALDYADFAVWQRDHWLVDSRLDQQRAFWREQLTGVPPLQVPTDRPRSSVRQAHGAVHSFRLPASVAVPLTELGRSRGATPFMSLLTVWHVLLAQHSQQWDFAVGIPVSGRVRPETHDMIGLFMNSIAIRPRLTADLSFEQALDQVRTVCLEALTRQDVPFDWVVDDVVPTRDLSRTPLYQALFDLQDEELTASGTTGDRQLDLRNSWRTTPTDLALIMRWQDAGELDGMLEYSSSLFDLASVRRLAEGFSMLAERAVARPNSSLRELSPFTGSELRRCEPAAEPATATSPAVAGSYQPPRNPFEQRLVEIWADALEVEVGVRDDFFGAGGNSVLAAMVTASARVAFAINIPVSALFDGPTVEQWAQVIESLIRADIDQLSEEEIADMAHSEGLPA